MTEIRNVVDAPLNLGSARAWDTGTLISREGHILGFLQTHVQKIRQQLHGVEFRCKSYSRMSITKKNGKQQYG